MCCCFKINNVPRLHVTDERLSTQTFGKEKKGNMGNTGKKKKNGFKVQHLVAILAASAALIGLHGASFAQGSLRIGGNHAQAGVHHLRAGFMPDPMRLQVMSGGHLDAGAMGLGNCLGMVEATPTAVVNYNSRRPNFLRFYVQSAGDTTLVINDPHGNWYCNDDGPNMGFNPEVVFQNAPSGHYDIWVGSYNRGERLRGQLMISELRHQNQHAGQQQGQGGQPSNYQPPQQQYQNQQYQNQNPPPARRRRRPARQRNNRAALVQSCDQATISSNDLNRCVNAAMNVANAQAVISACDRATISGDDLVSCIQASQSSRGHGPSIIQACDRATISGRDLVRCVQRAPDAATVQACDQATISGDDLVACLGG